jgi:hypothetical protein
MLLIKNGTFSAGYAKISKKPLQAPLPPHTGRNVPKK